MGFIMKKILYFIVIALLLGSCQKIIDISVPDQSRKIVLGSIINSDNLVVVRLSESKSILEDNDFILLEDAEVKLFEENQYVGTLNYTGSSRYVLPDFYPVNERTYRIEVNHQVLASVRSEIRIPKTVPILEIDTSSTISEYGNETYIVNVKIADPGGEDNFYTLSVAATSRVFDWNTQELTDSIETHMLYLNSIDEGDPGIGGELVNQDLNYFIDDKLFVSDALFDGQEHEFSVAIESYFFYGMADTVMLDVRLDHIDPSYYYYSVSKQKYYQADGNPFSEPVQVYNNIENGFGILSAYARASSQYNMIIKGEK